MTSCFFVSDLHGKADRYRKLFDAIMEERPQVVFLGGDLLPHPAESVQALSTTGGDFLHDCLQSGFEKVRDRLGERYPSVFLILGNDDPRSAESSLLEGQKNGLWQYIQNRAVTYGDFTITGYACVPPTPFLGKDWERYDVSRYVDPGCVPPEEGIFSGDITRHELIYSTMQDDLARLGGGMDFNRSVFLFHSPPYNTKLDRADLDGKMVDHVPLDPHIGSIAVRRFIEECQPYVTMHGHVHESCRLTGGWRERFGRTASFSAAHDGPELALVRFILENPDSVSRELL